MKATAFSFGILFLSIVTALAGNTFVGNITFSSTKNGAESGKVTLAVKNDLVAFTAGAGQQMVLNIGTGDFQSVMNQGNQKTLVKMNLSVFSGFMDLPAFFGPFSSYLKTGKSEGTSIEATAETKTINGYKCKKWIVKDKESVTTLWVTQDIPFSLVPLMDVLKSAEGIDPALKNSFPIQGTTKNTATNETTSFNVAVEKKAIEDKVFEFPADLLVMDMTPLIKQMLQNSDPAQVKAMLDKLMQF